MRLQTPLESFVVLSQEGQTFTNALSMTARATVSVVFAADLSSVAQSGSDWSVSFGNTDSREQCSSS